MNRDLSTELDSREYGSVVYALRSVADGLLDLRDQLGDRRERHNWPMGMEDAARYVNMTADNLATAAREDETVMSMPEEEDPTTSEEREWDSHE